MSLLNAYLPGSVSSEDDEEEKDYEDEKMEGRATRWWSRGWNINNYKHGNGGEGGKWIKEIN